MDACRVDFTLRRPMVVPEHPIHLDALLAWAAVEEGIETGVSMETAHDTLPLERETREDQWAWKASHLQILASKTGQITQARRFDPVQIVHAADDGHVVLGRKQNWQGEGSGSVYKAYLLTQQVQWVHAASAWFVGQASEVERLLQRVTHLGKLSRLGSGEIRTMTITPDPTATTRWQHRNMPWALPGYRQVMGSVHPPYWKRASWQPVWVPAAS